MTSTKSNTGRRWSQTLKDIKGGGAEAASASFEHAADVPRVIRSEQRGPAAKAMVTRSPSKPGSDKASSPAGSSPEVSPKGSMGNPRGSSGQASSGGAAM